MGRQVSYYQKSGNMNKQKTRMNFIVFGVNSWLDRQIQTY